MWLSVVEALLQPHPCACDCFHTLPLAERARSVAAMYRFDDALRGWGYEPVYELAGDRIYRIAQAKNDPSFRLIPVRDSACVYRRLVGFAVHEVIHAVLGDTSLANYGIPWGALRAVPDRAPRGREADALAPLNRAEAMAFVCVGPGRRGALGVAWPVYTARDVGTYGFVGANAIVPAPPGFRAVPHLDRVHHAARYYELARALEADAARALTAAKIDEICAAFGAAERAFAGRAPKRRPPPVEVAQVRPKAPGRNDLCACGSGKKAKRCCAA